MAYRLRPSAAPVWVVCPGMVRLTDGLEDGDDDPTTREEGTACHWVAHQTALGQPIPAVAPNGIEIDDDMLDAVDLYMRAVHAWPTNGQRYFEQPVHCFGIHEQCGGTLDVSAWDWHTYTLYLGDLKYGFRSVQPDSWQLICYIDGEMRRLGVQPKQVVLMICQPRDYGRDGQVKQITLSWEEVAPKLAYLRERAAIAMGDKPPCTTGPQCANCLGRARCEAVRNAAGTAFDMTCDSTPHALPFAAAENELRMLQWAKGVLDARISGLEQQVEHGITKGGERSRFYGMERGAGKLKWNEGAAAHVVGLAQIMGKSVEKPLQLITPTQATRVLGEEVVKMYAQRVPTAPKLTLHDAGKWRRIFGKN